MFYRLPPAGDPIELQSVSSPDEVLKEFFGEYAYRFYGSGTSALAAGLIAAIKANPKPNPEVLMPAYTCPALVSAALFAGAKPVLVDFEPDRPWMDLEDLQRKISPQTVAVIAVHLFGIPERLSSIQEISKIAGIFLIEDSAQFIPEQGGASWQGDFVILSFGRGKPVSLLGGGAVLTNVLSLREALPRAESNSRPWPWSTIIQKLKMRLYNRFLSPRLYWLPASLPFLHLGETRYEPLRGISSIKKDTLEGLAMALNDYMQRGNDVQTAIHSTISRLRSEMLVDLPFVCCGPQPPKLIRYPLLVRDPARRDLLFSALDTAGLGASVMYPTTLPDIAGLHDLFSNARPCQNAQHFAECVLTLPTHSAVRPADIQRIAGVLRGMS